MKTNNNMMIVFPVNSDGELMKKHQLTPFISIYHHHLVFITILYCNHQFIKSNQLTILRINIRFTKLRRKQTNTDVVALARSDAQEIKI